MMELRHLRYFVAVAEERGFGRASRRLRVAQQALSRQIADLEREVGAVLLLRVHTGAHLTPAGAQFLDGARRVLAEAARTAEQARRTAVDGGCVRVGSPEIGAATTVLRDAVASFRDHRPDTAVVYDSAPPAAQRDHLRAGTLDVGFATVVRVGADAAVGDRAADLDLLHARLTSDALSAVMVPGSYALAHAGAPADGTEADGGAGIPCDALSGLPLLIAHPTSPDDTEAMIEEFRRRGWRGRVDTAAGISAPLAALVAAGAGWLVTSRSVHRGTTPGTVQRDLAGGAVGYVDTHVVWRSDDGQGATADFVAMLRAHTCRTEVRVAPPWCAPDASSPRRRATDRMLAVHP